MEALKAGALLLTLAAASRAGSFSDLVEPYSYELERSARLPKPFVASFTSNGRHLYFLAGLHEHDTASKTFQLIDKIFNGKKVDLLLIEPYPYHLGPNLKGFLEDAKRHCKPGFCQAGEGAYAALKAVDLRIPFVGAEPSDRDILSAVLKMGYSNEDLLGFYFTRRLPSYKRQKLLTPDSAPRLFSKYIKAFPMLVAPKHPTDYTFEWFANWYQRRNNKTFGVKSFNDEEVAPLLDGKYFTQRLSGHVDIIRNRFIIDVLEKELLTHTDVFVLYGGSHYFSQRKALEAMMGGPAEISR